MKNNIFFFVLICSISMIHAADERRIFLKRCEAAQERDERAKRHVALLKVKPLSQLTVRDRQYLLVDFVNARNAFDALDLDEQRAVLSVRYERIKNQGLQKKRPVRTESIEAIPFLLLEDQASTPVLNHQSVIKIPKMTALHAIRVVLAKQMREMLARRAQENNQKPAWKHY